MQINIHDFKQDYPPQKKSMTITSIWHDFKWILEALLIAISFHLLIVPFIWIIGYALPWPRPPQRLTIYEINLKNLKVDVKTIKTTEVEK